MKVANALVPIPTVSLQVIQLVLLLFDQPLGLWRFIACPSRRKLGFYLLLHQLDPLHLLQELNILDAHEVRLRLELLGSSLVDTHLHLPFRSRVAVVLLNFDVLRWI
jgi:hypothetical protein